MKSGRGPRRSIRYSIFVGVLAGSVFSGSGAFAEPLTQANFYLTISENLAGNYTLEESIDISIANNGDAPVGSTVFETFTGTFDGANKTIYGLTVPLFDSISGPVSNLVLETAEKVAGNGVLANYANIGASIDGVHVIGDVNSESEATGGLIGSTGSGVTISNSTYSGDVTSTATQYVGGLVGSSGGPIEFSSSSGTVTASSGTYVGGLVGSSSGSIEDSFSTSSVNAISNVGGLVGEMNGNITNSYATGTLQQISPTEGNRIGGLVGVLLNNAEIFGSHATAGGESISGVDHIGGLVGQVVSGSISNSYANIEGNVTAQFGGYVGGLVGTTSGSITNSFAVVDGDITGAGNGIGGLVGDSGGSITNSYAVIRGDITGAREYVGGLAGFVSQNITNSYATVSGDVVGDQRVGGLAGYVQDITNSYATVGGDVIGTNAWAAENNVTGGLVGGLAGFARNINNSYVEVGGSVNANFLNWSTNPVGGLVGQSSGVINNSYASIALDVASSGSSLGGLAGYTHSSIDNSHVTVGGAIVGTDNTGGLVGYAYTGTTILNSNSSVAGNINGENYVGGLVGYAYTGTTILNSNSSVAGNVTGTHSIGGLVGYGASSITDSNALVLGNINGVDYIGGLVGNTASNIENSDASVRGNLIATGESVGGLVGYFSAGSIINSNSSIDGTFSGYSRVGGLIGSFYGGNIISSFYMLNEAVGGTNLPDLVGYHYISNSYTVDYEDDSLVWNVSDVPQIPSKLQIVGNPLDAEVFAIDQCLNGPNPYLLSLTAKYENSCSGSGGNSTPPRRERIEREAREIKEVRSAEKIEKASGFKSETSLPKTAAVSFVESTEKFDISKIMAVEIAATANVRVNAKAGEALQISLKSESKEPMELWVKSPDGSWLLAGVITFDKDGKAILPPLQFKNTGDYSLVLSKPSADSAKGSAPLNQTGSLLVAVS